MIFKSKIFIRTFLCLFFSFIVLTSTAFALDHSILYFDVEEYKQEQSMWCWNATARMCADHHYNVTLSQTQVAEKLFWPWGAKDWGADMAQTAKALRYYTDSTKQTGSFEGSCSFNTIAGKMEATNNPIVLAVYYTYTGEHHDLAVHAFNTSYGNGDYLQWVDPKYPSEQEWSYTEYFNGTNTTGMAYFLPGEW